MHEPSCKLAFVAAVCLVTGLTWPASAGADEPYVHVVYAGQRLGSIAKRYNVSIDAICTANGIKRKDPIHPGQKLVIPGKTQKGKKGETARRKPARRESETRAKREVDPDPPKKHKVYKGQRLSSIAKRYNVSIESICHASGIDPQDPIHPGDTLLIPGKGDETGSYARSLRVQGEVSVVEHPQESAQEKARRRSGESWRKYKKTPYKRGYVTLVGFNESWKGYVIGPNNEVLPRARQEISKVLAATGKRPRIHPRLIELIAKVSDTFGGRALRVVSGYRERSYAAASRHRTGRALDFSVPGVPNEAVRDYLRSFNDVGVGYYPNSTFVHLDVREGDTYWIDYSGPGEAPRYRRVSASADEAGAPE